MRRRPLTEADQVRADQFRAGLDRLADELIASGIDSALVAAALLGASARLAVTHGQAETRITDEQVRAMFVRGALMQINNAFTRRDRS